MTNVEEEDPVKYRLLSLAITMVLIFVGPMIAAASSERESPQGMEALGTCVKCHGDLPEYPVRGAALEYESSGHATLGNSHYANGSGCQQCHTSEGFIEYTRTGTVDAEGYVRMPSQQGCFTCHTPHTTWDFSLRTVSAVKLANGATFDIGAGNLCASCHRARENAQEAVVPTAANQVRSFYGAHHGPQADILMGTNAYEFAGYEYSSSKHREIVRDSCAICHMSLPAGRYNLSPEVGGHSFNIVGEVHEAPVVNTSACINCHDNIAQIPGTELVNVMAEYDFDRDGETEPVQEEVLGLLARFVDPDGSGLLQNLDPPFYGPTGEFVTPRVDTIRPVTEMAALYNYKLILEDRSKGVHNSTYTIQILYDSIKALDPGFDNSLRPE